MKAIYAIIFMSLLVFYGCSQSVPETKEPSKTQVQDAEVDSEPVVQDIDKSIQEIEDLENELEDPSLDNIDEELADINW